MNHYKINTHMERCKNSTQSVFYESKMTVHEFCNFNPETLLFYLCGEFCLVTYFRCIRGHNSENEFIFDVIKQINSKAKNTDYKDINRSVRFNKEFKEMAKRSRATQSKIDEVNFIYGGFGSNYCITIEYEYSDNFIKSFNLDENYAKAIDYLNKNGYEHLTEEATQLYNANKHDVDLCTTVETIDMLVKQINKLIK